MTDAYICDGIRTPVGRFGGALAPVRPDDLGAMVLKFLLENNPKLAPDAIDDVVFGCANQAGEDNRNVARMSALLAGLPESVPGTTVNRLCGSGMDAIGIAARAIKSGEQQLVLAGGVESMSRAPFVMGKAEKAFSREPNGLYDTTIGWRFINPRMKAQYGVDAMPETAENVADDFNVSREDQDLFAFASQQKAAKAQQEGILAEEIMPVTVALGRGKTLEFSADEHLRPDTTLEALNALKAPFKPDGSGSVTAGNASGVNDGAAALIVASKAAAERHGLTPKARIVAMATAGVPPRVMGIGPVPAVKKLLAQTGISLDEIGVIELNEAFAAQGLAVLRELGLKDNDARVNPNGGAIAIGHPLGMSGARLVLTATRQLHRSGERYALCTMCIGVGQGIAMLLERV